MARYHFHGMTIEMCKEPNCPDCPELYNLFNELCTVDSKYRQEWMKLVARTSRVPQRAFRNAEYRRKRGHRF